MLKADPVIAATADACAVFRAERTLPAHRTHCETTYAAKSRGGTKRRVIARIEATTLGMDIRTLVPSIRGSTPERLYEFTYCDRGRAENLPPIDCRQSTAGQWIKLHKTQLKSDRTSCMTAAANQMRLILHTAAYWLLWTVQQEIPEKAPLKRAEFATLQIRLVKIGARIIETASRIRIAIASACPDKTLIAHPLPGRALQGNVPTGWSDPSRHRPASDPGHRSRTFASRPARPPTKPKNPEKAPKTARQSRLANTIPADQTSTR